MQNSQTGGPRMVNAFFELLTPYRQHIGEVCGGGAKLQIFFLYSDFKNMHCFRMVTNL